MSNSARHIEAEFAGTVGSFRLQVAFQFPTSGVTALFGPSGSGKTTILRCIAGLQRLPGRLLVDGETWQDDARGVFRKPHQRRLGYVFQEASLFPHLSVRGNLLYGARRAGVTPVLTFDAVVQMLGLGLLLERAPAALSGGERQRVAVGRALLSQPRLLLMDEPLSALDRSAREEIIAYFEVLHRELSVPMLYVSHDLAEVARLSDHLVVLAAGGKLAEGPVQEILERLDLHPTAERFEAGVVLDVRVAAHDTRYHLSRLRHGRQIITVPLVDAAVGAPVRLRIRARDVALATRRPRAISIRNVLPGTVTAIREQPGTAYAEALVDIGGGRLRARITREAAADLALRSGKRVFALVKSISFERPSPS
jgi:molybdate transport system ATP-binding protein